MSENSEFFFYRPLPGSGENFSRTPTKYIPQSIGPEIHYVPSNDVTTSLPALLTQEVKIEVIRQTVQP